MLQALQLNICIFIYKILSNILPEVLRNRIEIVGSDGEKQTRQTGNTVLKFRKTRSAQKSIFHEGIKTYDSLPAMMKQCDRIASFKRTLKQYILSTIL